MKNPERDAAIIEAVRQNVKLMRDIAAEYGMTRQRVRAIAREAGLARRDTMPRRPNHNKRDKTLTLEIVRHYLTYNPETGEFRWAGYTGNGKKAGTIAGTLKGHERKDRYRRIGLNGRYYSAARLAFLYVHGRMPNGEIDHINGDGLDDRISNLREATHSQNARNRRKVFKNSSIRVGVSFRKTCNKYGAYIRANNKNIVLGVFERVEDAISARENAERELWGEFARGSSK